MSTKHATARAAGILAASALTFGLSACGDDGPEIMSASEVESAFNSEFDGADVECPEGLTDEQQDPEQLAEERRENPDEAPMFANDYVECSDINAAADEVIATVVDPEAGVVELIYGEQAVTIEA